ncbi:hypothetical protein A6A08_21495 [Nocardiopsis sp. TSRI0078]|nr:hypothetical protein A6A08_21495 [Nocardiopsis sp. TSRI0078]
MPSGSVQRRTAKARLRYSGEFFHEAEAGLPRDKTDHGLDTCTSEQQALRALLAIAVFNSDGLGAPPRDWGIHVIRVYTLRMSARFNDLHIATDCPWNVSRRINTPRADSAYRIPGLRTLCHRFDHTTLRHLPTRAFLLVRFNHEEGSRLVCGRPCPDSDLDKDMLPVDHPMGPQEISELATVPPMSPAAQTLLAALLVRMALQAPDGTWATAGWHYPPRDIPNAFPNQNEIGKALWGANDHWSLRWYGFPNPEFVAAALTDPVIGLAGATVEDVGNDFVVSYRSARLRLVEHNRHMLGSTQAVLQALERQE